MIWENMGHTTFEERFNGMDPVPLGKEWPLTFFVAMHRIIVSKTKESFSLNCCLMGVGRSTIYLYCIPFSPWNTSDGKVPPKTSDGGHHFCCYLKKLLKINTVK